MRLPRALGLFAIISTFIFGGGVAGVFLPATAYAAGHTCQAPVIGNFTPNIFDGELQSFDFFISPTQSAKYLPFGIEIDGQDMALESVSVWNKDTNNTRVHVDVPTSISSSISGNTQVNVAILQLSEGPPPTCIFTNTFTFNASVHSMPTTAPAPVLQTPQAPIDPSPVVPSTEAEARATGGDTEGEEEVGASEPEAVFGILGGRAEGEMCESPNQAVWVGALLIALAVAFATIAWMPEVVRTNARLAVAVIVPLIASLLLWYFLDICQSALWFPVAMLLIAIGVLWASSTPDLYERIRVRTEKLFSDSNAANTVKTDAGNNPAGSGKPLSPNTDAASKNVGKNVKNKEDGAILLASASSDKNTHENIRQTSSGAEQGKSQGQRREEKHQRPQTQSEREGGQDNRHGSNQQDNQNNQNKNKGM